MPPDFFFGTMLNVREAWFVVNSAINLCCQPSVLSFSQRNVAERFAQGFGGFALDFVRARNKIGEMTTRLFLPLDTPTGSGTSLFAQ